MPKGVQGKWTEGVGEKSRMIYAFILEGQIVNHVCVKGLNDNVNSFCTEVEKYMFWTVCRTSAITTQTPHSAATWLLWCSQLTVCRTSAITTQTPHSAATWSLWCSELYIT